MINFIIWLIAGAAIGGLATLIFRRRRAILLVNIIVGSIGASVFSFLSPTIYYVHKIIRFSLLGLLVSLGTTIVLLMAVNFFARERNVAKDVLGDQWRLMRRAGRLHRFLFLQDRRPDVGHQPAVHFDRIPRGDTITFPAAPDGCKRVFQR